MTEVIRIKSLRKSSAKLTSSKGTLIRICTLLLPFVGDPHRSLSNIEYRLHDDQFSLLGYHYNINSLATDLRDGVKLARLAELLLDFPSSRSRSEGSSTNRLSTSKGPKSMIALKHSQILTQHLKFPCVARAQKMYNVELALGALRESGQIEGEIKAEDIVDGHRERTIALLWQLVGKWSLGKVIDLECLQREIGRLGRSNRSCSENEHGVGQGCMHDLRGVRDPDSRYTYSRSGPRP